jgi:hypothetical protein
MRALKAIGNTSLNRHVNEIDQPVTNLCDKTITEPIPASDDQHAFDDSRSAIGDPASPCQRRRRFDDALTGPSRRRSIPIDPLLPEGNSSQ